MVLKIAKKIVDLECDASEVKIQSALTRRSLAFDQVGLASFIVQEEWHAKIFQCLQREPPNGYRYVTLQQVLAADKQLWTLVSQDTRNTLQIVAGEPAPLDSAIQKFANEPQMTACLTNLPAPHHTASSSGSHGPQQEKKSKPQSQATAKTSPSAKGGGKNTDRIAYLLKNMPPNCVSKSDTGKFFCLRYQVSKCRYQKKKQCNNGLHQCYYKGCHKERPCCECQH